MSKHSELAEEIFLIMDDIYFGTFINTDDPNIVMLRSHQRRAKAVALIDQKLSGVRIRTVRIRQESNGSSDEWESKHLVTQLDLVSEIAADLWQSIKTEPDSGR